MALTREQLAKLPPSVAALLQSQSMGDQALPQQNDPAQGVLSNLQGALGRRFGETQDFDAEYDAAMRGMIGEVPGLQASYEKNRQRLGEDFTLTAEQLDRQNEQNRSRHLNEMANRGLGYAGANLVGQERIGEQFQRSVQGAGQAYTRGLDDLSTSEADAYRRIQERASATEATAAERARVRDETRKWQQEQQRLEQDRLAREQQQQEAALAEQQRQNELMNQQLSALEQQALAASQPMPTANGTYASPAAANPATSFNTDTNVSVWQREYNLRDPNEVKELQYSLGLRPDGIVGPQTIAALQGENAVYFNDRPIDPSERLRQSRGTMYTYPGAPR